MFAAELKWMLGRILRLVPEGVLARVLPRAFRFNARNLPPAPNAPDKAIRLYIGPVNWAGQGQQWARAVERYVPNAGAVSMAYHLRTEFGHPVDDPVPVGYYLASRSWQRRQYAAVREGFTHVMVEAERQPFGAVLDESLEQQVHRLLADGLGVIMLCHGSDIRLPSRHAAANAFSPFRDSLWDLTPRLERAAAQNRQLLDRLELPVFVSTPDLLLDVPYARWLPVVVDPAAWATTTVPLQRLRPIVAHAPSKTVVKGTDLIDPILRKLEREGLIDYRRVHGVPADEIVDLYRSADVVLDQFRIGSYGVAACEAMAAGRLVVSHVTEQVRAHVRSTVGLDLPIVESDATGLETVLRGILTDRDRYRERAKQGSDFVGAVHDGRMSAEVLRPFLLRQG